MDANLQSKKVPAQKRDDMINPILIDALHINMGGALMILNHLVDRLVDRDIDYVLLKDDRCPRLRSEDKVKRMEVMSCAESVRKRYYKANRKDFKAILCLGNIPPAIKMPVPVHTYIHNVSLLDIPADYPLKSKIKSRLKRLYLRSLAKNTDTWIVQTSNTAEIVKRQLPCKNKRVLEYPFFFIPENMNRIPWEERRDYVFIGEETGAKGMRYLIEAWKILSGLGFRKTLHLTTIAPELKDQIDDAIAAGARINNHGRVDFDEVISLYNHSKAIIYPSLNESLGLGIIEAAYAGCDIIGCDLPYLHAVCIPSASFKPCDSKSIAETVLRYEKGRLPKTMLTIRDMSDKLIDLIVKNHTPNAIK